MLPDASASKNGKKRRHNAKQLQALLKECLIFQHSSAKVKSRTKKMNLRNLKKLEALLRKAAAEKNLALRGVKVAAVVAEALRQIGEDPVLVGGGAVEFYTEGGYATKDIDMVAVGGAPLWGVMQQLGFMQQGKDFIRNDLKIYIELPSETLNEGEQSDLLDVGGIPLKIISLEDLVVDRLCAYKF